MSDDTYLTLCYAVTLLAPFVYWAVYSWLTRRRRRVWQYAVGRDAKP